MDKKQKNNDEHVKLTKAEKLEHKEILRELQSESEIPQSLLDQISNFSPNGFVLFTLDEKGNVITNTKFEADSSLITLSWHALQWSHAQDFMNSEMFKRGFFQNIEPPNE